MTNEKFPSKEEFRSFIKKLLEKSSAEQIAEAHGEVAASTIRRWAYGVSSPLPRARKIIIDLLTEKLLKKAD